LLSKRLRGFSLIEAVVALAITAMIMGSLGFLLIYATRTLRQSFSDSTVQQQGLLALRRVSDDLVQSNLYSVYSVADPVTAALVTSGMNVTLLSPFGASGQTGDKLLQYDATTGRLRFRSWVGYNVDAEHKLIRSDFDTGAGLPLQLGSPPPLLTQPSPADFTTPGPTHRSTRTVARGIVVTEPNGSASPDGFAIRPAPANQEAFDLSLRVQDFFGSGSNRFSGLNFSTRLYVRNTSKF